MDVTIDSYVDKEPLHCVITNDKVINVTGEGGSGKTTYCDIYRKNSDYIVIDYDLIIADVDPKNTLEHSLREMLLRKHGVNFFRTNTLEEKRKVFTTMYEEIVDYLLPSGKTLVLDGTQLRFIDDVKKIRGELLVLRPSIETCVQRSVKRKKEQSPNISLIELRKYEQKRRETLIQLNPLLNEFIINVDKKLSDKSLFSNSKK